MCVTWAHLEQSCQFGLSVGHVARLFLGERLYDLAQAGQGQVDALALVEGGPGVSADPRLAVPLTSRQVHQV